MKLIDDCLDELVRWVGDDPSFPEHIRQRCNQLVNERDVLGDNAMHLFIKPVRSFHREIRAIRDRRSRIKRIAETIDELDRQGLRSEELSRLQRELNELTIKSNAAKETIDAEIRRISKNISKLETNGKIGRDIAKKRWEITSYFSAQGDTGEQASFDLIDFSITRILIMISGLSTSIEGQTIVRDYINDEFERIKDDLKSREEELLEQLDHLHTLYPPTIYGLHLKSRFNELGGLRAKLRRRHIADLHLAVVDSLLRNRNANTTRPRYQKLFELKRDSLFLLDNMQSDRLAAIAKRHGIRDDE